MPRIAIAFPLLLFLLGACSIPRAGARPSPLRATQQTPPAVERPLLRFGVIADCQYCSIERAGNRHYAKSIGKLRTCVEHFNALDLDFAVHLGDFIDRDWESFDAVGPIYDQLAAPHHHVLGNHDFSVPDEKKAEVPARMGLESRYYAFDRGAFRFVVIDGNDLSFYAHPEGSPAWRRSATFYKASGGTAPKWNGAVGLEQLEWLDRMLAAATSDGRRAFVLCHFPVFPENQHNLWNAEQVVRVMESHDGFAGYLNGHNHAGNFGTRADRPYLTFHGMVDTETTAYAVVTVYDDRLEIDGHGREPDRTVPLRPAPEHR